ncbi:MAG: class I SAM-dependent methyltransferase [Patescibacteria group bacterium]
MRESSFGKEKNSVLDRLLFSLRARAIINRLKKVDNPKTALDIGCGYRGHFLSRVLPFFPTIEQAVGVDVSVDNTATHEKIKLISGDVNGALPLPDNHFDIVFSTAVLEHLENYTLALKEMHRVLKPGGYLLLTTPAPAAKLVLELLAYQLKLIDEREIRDHKRYFTRPHLKQLLCDLGYSDVKVKPFQFGFNTIAVGKK